MPAAVAPATNVNNAAGRPVKAVATTVAEPRWEGLIETEEENLSDLAALAVRPTRRPPWVWFAAAAGVLMLGLFAAWLGGVFKVKTPDGVIVLENVPEDADILVDGGKVSVTFSGDGSPVEIRAVPGRHKVEVKKDGFATFAKELTIKANGSQEVTVRLEPLVAVAARPGSGDSGHREGRPSTRGCRARPGACPFATGRSDETGKILRIRQPCFNGKDLPAGLGLWTTTRSWAASSRARRAGTR